ncbi:MAG: hypothetical protein R3A44_26875 [Caldilineaceae bacterium]
MILVRVFCWGGAGRARPVWFKKIWGRRSLRPYVLDVVEGE